MFGRLLKFSHWQKGIGTDPSSLTGVEYLPLPDTLGELLSRLMSSRIGNLRYPKSIRVAVSDWPRFAHGFENPDDLLTPGDSLICDFRGQMDMTLPECPDMHVPKFDYKLRVTILFVASDEEAGVFF